MHIDGSCHCGDIAYEAEIDPAKVALCHCTDCQVMSGSAFRSLAFTREGSFRLRSGTPALYVKTGDSGNKREQGFCPRCGTPIYSAPPGDGPKVHVLRAGTIRQRDALVPKVEFWCRSARSWVAPHSEAMRFDTQPSFSPKGAAD